MSILGTSLASKMRPLRDSDGLLNVDTSRGTGAGPVEAGVKESHGGFSSSATPGVSFPFSLLLQASLPNLQETVFKSDALRR
jgi:hypothetical protein